MLNILKKIVADTFQSGADQIKQITGFGEVNQVYKVTVGSDPYLIRLQEGRDALHEYKKEAWCLGQARKFQLNVPSVLAINELDQCAYMVESFIDGIKGSCHPDKLLVWRILGDAARRLKEVPVQGFGGDLIDEDSGTFSDRFSSTLDKQIHYNLITAGAQTHAERRAFLEGYGLSGEDFRKQEPEYALFSMLHHFDTLRWAIDRLPKANWRPYVIQAKQAVAIVTQVVTS